MGKRLNQVARETGAITISDLLRDRYESPALGLFTTCAIIFFTTANLVAQFKAGGIIVEETFNLGGRGGYLAGLLLFAAVVVLYTAYGGFRAVVWTDVIQGIVMVSGVLILLPVVLERAGGLESVHQKLLGSPPTVVTSIPGPHNDLAFVLDKSLPAQERPLGVEYLVHESPGQGLEALIEPVGDANATLRVLLPALRSGQTGIPASEVKRIVEQTPETARLLEGVHYAFDNDGSGEVTAMPLTRFIPEREFLTGPGRHSDGRPFHPLGLALSFFIMWSITNMGQPGLMETLKYLFSVFFLALPWPSPLTRISHRRSTTSPQSSALAVFRSVGLLDVLYKYDCGGLGRKPCQDSPCDALLRQAMRNAG